MLKLPSQHIAKYNVNQEAVEKLYYLRDHFYDTENEFQEEKWDFIRREMKNTVALLRKSKDTDGTRKYSNHIIESYTIYIYIHIMVKPVNRTNF